MLTFPIIAVFISTSITFCFASQEFTPFDEPLKQLLIDKCDLLTRSRPVHHVNQSVEVVFNLWPHKFGAISDLDQTLTLTAEIQLNWMHPCASWQKIEGYQDVPFIEIPASQTFYPKIYLLNSVSDLSVFARIVNNIDVYIVADGSFWMFAAESFTVSCPLDLKKFPFDEQECQMRFQAFYNKNITDFQLGYNGTGVSDALNKTEFIPPASVWELVRVSGRIDVVRSGSTYLQQPVITFRFARIYGLYVVNIFFPNVCLSLLLIGIGCMWPKLPDRPVFCATIVLALGVSHSVVSESLPHTSEIVWSVVFLTYQIVLGVVATLYALLSHQLARKKYYERRYTWGPYGPIGPFVVPLIRALDLVVFSGFALATFLADMGIFYMMVAG